MSTTDAKCADAKCADAKYTEAKCTEAIPSNRQVIRGFFDEIATQYDFLNHFLSFRLDESWRKRAKAILYNPAQKTILDLGIGTGKFLKTFLEIKKWDRAVGLDFSSEMLKGSRKGLPEYVSHVSADFHALPLKENSFDLIISSFTLRSVKDMPAFLGGVFRSLSPKGTVGFLCLTRPRSPFWNLLYYPYLKFYLPLVGGLFSGNKDAYRFLAASILVFQEPAKTVAMMEEIGFTQTAIHPFSLGMATLIVGKKPDL